MAVGLTFRQLLATFFEALNNRSNEFDAQVLIAKEGLNPIIKQYLDMHPDFTESQSRAYIIHLEAILDTILLNNEAIAKSLPP